MNRKSTYIIGEIGQNHNGSVEIAKQMVDMVARPVREDDFSLDLKPMDAVKMTKRDLDEELTASQMNRPYDSPNSFGRTYGEHRAFLELSDEAQICQGAGSGLCGNPLRPRLPVAAETVHAGPVESGQPRPDQPAAALRPGRDEDPHDPVHRHGGQKGTGRCAGRHHPLPRPDRHPALRLPVSDASGQPESEYHPLSERALWPVHDWFFGPYHRHRGSGRSRGLVFRTIPSASRLRS